jgi:anti-anti-sigma factor
MSVSVRDLGGVLVLEPDGPNLDFLNHGELRQAFLSASQLGRLKAVVVNLEKVDQIDSVGLGALIGGRLWLRRICEISLCGLQPLVERQVRATRLHLLFPIYENPHEALGLCAYAA